MISLQRVALLTINNHFYKRLKKYLVFPKVFLNPVDIYNRESKGFLSKATQQPENKVEKVQATRAITRLTRWVNSHQQRENRVIIWSLQVRWKIQVKHVSINRYRELAAELYGNYLPIDFPSF